MPVVFVATGGNFPDALSAAAAAALLGGPLLLTAPTALAPSVRAEIARLAPGRILISGGPSVVSERVAAELAAIAPVQRLAGGDRYATGLAVVNEAFAASDHAIIATGASFPDALAATGAAGSRQAPVILVEGTRSALDAATLSTLQRLGVSSVGISGGPSVVSTGIENQLRGLGLSVMRYGGSDRYVTASLINGAYFPSGTTDTLFLATGMDFPDALAGAALAGRLAAPLFITDRACLPESVHTQVSALGATKRVVMGGPSVVSDNAAAVVKCVPAGNYVSNAVSPGAFCPTVNRGWYGWTVGGVLMQCKTTASDSVWRWRAV